MWAAAATANTKLSTAALTDLAFPTEPCRRPERSVCCADRRGEQHLRRIGGRSGELWGVRIEEELIPRARLWG